jgi:hypothetical protein
MSETEDMRLSDDGSSRIPAWDLPTELKSFEARLAALSPRGDRLDRERLMFLAGQASMECTPRSNWASARSPLEHKAWPAAFTLMSAVAASLLAILVTEMDVSAPSPASRSGTDIVQFRVPSAVARTVLSPRDAHRENIDRWLAQDDFSRPAADSSAAVPPDMRRTQILTPGAWNEALNDFEFVRPSSDGASNLQLFSGATT